VKPAGPLPQLLERHITKQVCDFLCYRGWRPLRTQFAFSPGSFGTGEPGMADYLFLRYLGDGHQAVLALWIEFKGPRDRRTCSCRPGERRVCHVCRQRRWQERERQRGALVWVVDDFDFFAADYEKTFGWLHSGQQARGQLDLLGGGAA
jgi:hypothetical protein